MTTEEDGRAEMQMKAEDEEAGGKAESSQEARQRAELEEEEKEDEDKRASGQRERGADGDTRHGWTRIVQKCANIPRPADPKIGGALLRSCRMTRGMGRRHQELVGRPAWSVRELITPGRRDGREQQRCSGPSGFG